MSAHLEQLQQALEQLYRLDPAPNITHFLINDQDVRNVHRPGVPRRREELVIVEEEDLFVGVKLDRKLVERLADDQLAATNLQEFCLAVEGVSHFLFVVHRARNEQPTSILELELQAEIDKYVACLMLVERCPSLPPDELRRRLYDSFRLLDDLSREEQARYRRANALARRYARQLEHRFVRRSRLPAMLGELRRFYRMGYRAKQERIQRAH